VAVVGSGFGGSVAALRFAEAGERVLVLERGGEVSRAAFEADLDALWRPERNAFGFHDLRRGSPGVLPWLGAAVGGGSHVYAGTLMRRAVFADLPGGIDAAEMERHYRTAEAMMAVVPYPSWPPYGAVRATRLLFRAGARLAAEHPELVRAHGPAPMGVSFAPPGGRPGAPFLNAHGAAQRYQDPREQALLGGDIDAKNSLDRNYLFLAVKRGARILPLHQVEWLERIPGGFRLHCRVWRPEGRSLRGLLRRLLPGALGPNWEPATFTARRVVVAAGALGSTELLLRCRDLHRTLPELSPRLGQRYTTNGDWLTFLLPARCVGLAWLGFLGAGAALLLGQPLPALAGAALYYGALAWAGRAVDPDRGTTTSDFIELVGPEGEAQGLLLEGGRYPSPEKGLLAVALSLCHAYTPRRYLAISRAFRVVRALVPPFGALARSWPIPLLTMGADQAVGEIALLGDRAVVRIDLSRNRTLYAWANRMARLLARAAGALWLPNLPLLLLGTQEVPHNQGGCPMADGPEGGVVDDRGRVFGVDDLMVLDGSILPVSPRPNPALTILALAERAMEEAVRQLRAEGRIAARPRPPAP
jgi:cholesterol oxidase